jgi:pyrroline-5-carboxylate reductase
MQLRKIGFVGAGKMAQALAAGFSRTVPGVSFVFVDPSSAAQEAFQQCVNRERSNANTCQITCVSSSQSVFDKCELVVLATKPQMAESALAGLSRRNPSANLVVSIMAGVTIGRIRELCGQQRIIRIMPNTPCLIGLGASAMATSEAVLDDEQSTIEHLLASVGIVEKVTEDLLDAVTGLSGSGPAFVFSFVESMIRAGIAVGLPPVLADRLARQTVLGAASMLSEPENSPAELRSQVTSPGGTTLAGLAMLEKYEFERAIVEAVLKATARAKELGES